MIIDENVEDPGYAKIVLIKVFWVNEGSVMVYDVQPRTIKGGMHMSSFFMCTFDNMVDEAVYGVGPSVVEALRNAAEQWHKYAQDDFYNPFLDALNQFKRDV